MVSSVLIPTDQSLITCSASDAQTESFSPLKVPLYIRLSDRLGDPAEAACAKAVSSWLSGKCDRVVGCAELEGLLLYLWSEDDVQGIGLVEYLDGKRPLQALLLEARGLSGDSLASAKLVPFAGQRFVFAAEVPS